MKLYCKAEYHNGPHGLHFTGPSWIEVDDWKAEFLLHDAPENFAREGPSELSKALDAPPQDKQVKAPPRKKSE